MSDKKVVKMDENGLNSFLAIVSEQLKDKPNTMQVLSQILHGAIIKDDAKEVLEV